MSNQHNEKEFEEIILEVEELDNLCELEEQIQNSTGTIETLERQVVQSGIKNKIMEGSVEIDRQKMKAQQNIASEEMESKARQKFYRNVLESDVRRTREDIKNEHKKQLDKKQ